MILGKFLSRCSLIVLSNTELKIFSYLRRLFWIMVHKMFTTHDAWHIVEVFIIFTTSGLSEEESYMLPNQTRNSPFAIY